MLNPSNLDIAKMWGALIRVEWRYTNQTCSAANRDLVRVAQQLAQMKRNRQYVLDEFGRIQATPVETANRAG